MGTKQNIKALGGITFGNKTAFWTGMLSVISGVILQLPMYLKSADRGYQLAGIPMDGSMMIGMTLVLVGLATTIWGLFPQNSPQNTSADKIKVRALDDVTISPSHIGLLIVMAIAVTIDVMKPTTLSFVLPGMAKEYGLRSPVNPGGSIPAALLPLSGITGTVLGSFLWGWLGDRIGRRASILMAGITFIATSACGSMPAYWMNVLMCFIMGLGVGGMLPIIFTIMSETIPARHRGWIMVLIGGDVAGAYIISSWLASTLVPLYSWRILWLLGLPTGVLLILLNRWIPESPRYLLANNRTEEAKDVMLRYGASIVRDESSKIDVEQKVNNTFLQLLKPPYLRITSTIILLALGVGLVSFGFQLWIPSNLQKIGYGEAEANLLLRNSALIGFPLNFLVAWMYGFWSSKKTLILLTGITALALLGFVIAGNDVVQNKTLLYALLIMPIWGISSVVAVLSAYTAEVFPTRIRSRGSGLSAGFSKAGGVLIIALVAISVAPPSIAGTALIGAIPLALSVLAIWIFGAETRKRQLEEITEEQLSKVIIQPAE